MEAEVAENLPLFSNDAIVFGLLMAALGLVFYTAELKGKGWKKFYTFFPPLLMWVNTAATIPIVAIQFI